MISRATARAILVLSALAAAPALRSQDIAGLWTAVPASGPMARFRRIVVNFSRGREESLKATAFGGQAAEIALSCSAIFWDGRKLSFTLQGPGVLQSGLSFSGTLSADGNTIDGWLQSEPLKLERAKRIRVPPHPPAAVSPATASGAAAVDSSELLTRALGKLAGIGRQLVRYTCIETIERSYYGKPARKLRSDILTEAPANSCGGVGFDAPGLTLEADDRLRLAVAMADGKEIQSWAGATAFDSRSVYELVPDGPRSTGAFGGVLVDIFANAGARYNFLGPKTENGTVVYEYSFEVPLRASHYFVKAGEEWRNTAYSGSFAVDVASGELVRVRLETAPLDPVTKMCRLRTATDYHYAPIGDATFLVPTHSEMDTVSPDAEETRSITRFSACHEYAAESSVSFGPGDAAPEAAAKGASPAAPPLPAGLSLTVALLDPIDTASAAAGDAVAARVTRAVRAPGSNETLIAAGAIVHGRLVKLQHVYGAKQFQYAIHYDTLEQNGAPRPIAIQLEREIHAEQRSSERLGQRGTEFSLPPPTRAGETGSWFAVPAATGRYVIPAGSESKWVTVEE